jgi:predicted transposase YbfD/YdcC
MGLVVQRSIVKHFKSLPDPRIERTKRHLLIDILTIALVGVICGAEGFNEIADFGVARKDWFARFLALPGGIPSHDTFARVFARLDPDSFSNCFFEWTSALCKMTAGRVVAVDGKTLRHSFDTAAGLGAIHMVSAWASNTRMVLGQVKVDGKSNEITAIPKLLDILDIEGAIVTIDAMGTQKAIAAQIIGKGADYLLSLKDNHPNLRADVQAYLDRVIQEQFRDHEDNPIPHTTFKSMDKKHGRLETRTCWALDCPDWVEGSKEWKELKSIAVIESQRQVNGHTSVERRYYISSLQPDARQIARAARSHWGIENSLHWVLDTVFKEDECRIRKDNSPQNMAVVRHIALNLLKSEKTINRSIKRKRFLAAIDEDYLTKVVFPQGE